MNILLHGLPDHEIRKSDTIRDPKLLEDNELRLFDRVIASPPFSLKEWGRESAEHDTFGRLRFGICHNRIKAFQRRHYFRRNLKRYKTGILIECNCYRMLG